MTHSLLDLADLRLSAEDFLGAVLETVDQPIWVVDPDDRIRFANPAAIAALGYHGADELIGCRSHETIHHKHPDGSPYPAADCPLRLPRATGERVASELDWFVRRDGSMVPVSYVSAPIEMPEGRGAVVAFFDIGDRLRSEQLQRERDAMLAGQQASLRRVATLVAGGAPSADVFAAIAREVGRVIGLPLIAIWRYEPDGIATVIGAWSEQPHEFQAGTRWRMDGPTITAKVRETGRPARIEDFSDVPGTVADAAREAGIRSCAGAPIVVGGEVWGVMSADSTDSAPLPERIEDRLAEFTELIATAISTTEARTEVRRLADEQAALRRVATLVAQGVPPGQLFDAVAKEVGTLLEVDLAGMIRYVGDRAVTAVAVWSAEGEHLDVEGVWPLEGDRVASRILATGEPAREDDWAAVSGPLGTLVRDELGVRSSVGSPIAVEGRVWGALFVHSKAQRLPSGTKARLSEFTELVATAVANTQVRSDLAESRARVVAAADDERRRVARDLHDGAQQRLVHTVLTLKLVRDALEHQDESAPALVAEALEQAEIATAELRELVHGILPSILTGSGFRAAVQSLSARMPIPVEIDVSVGRLPSAVEATAYFVVAEALTNVAKHARAQHASVTAHVRDGTACVAVRDDGVGGARADGSGLIGLADRLAALDGAFRVDSSAGGGTLVTATFPLP